MHRSTSAKRLSRNTPAPNTMFGIILGGCGLGRHGPGHRGRRPCSVVSTPRRSYGYGMPPCGRRSRFARHVVLPRGHHAKRGRGRGAPNAVYSPFSASC